MLNAVSKKFFYALEAVGDVAQKAAAAAHELVSAVANAAIRQLPSEENIRSSVVRNSEGQARVITGKIIDNNNGRSQ